MSKIKDTDKTLIEKRKDFKIEKLEKPELKEKPEKQEIKEWKEKNEKIERKEFKELKIEQKEKPERKEFKEPIKEKVEVKEIKEFEKQVPEKGGKEIAEGGFDPGELIQPRADMADTAEDTATASATAAAKVADKQLEKIQKDIEKIKPEKEHLKNELKEFKHEKNERKEFKHEKIEIKELKQEIEKHHHKDFLPDKLVFENDPKGIVEVPGGGPPKVDPREVFTAEGPERLTQLEEAVMKLAHFIGADLRPDLSSGALKSEPDVAGAKTDEAKTDDKTKKK